MNSTSGFQNMRWISVFPPPISIEPFLFTEIVLKICVPLVFSLFLLSLPLGFLALFYFYPFLYLPSLCSLSPCLYILHVFFYVGSLYFFFLSTPSCFLHINSSAFISQLHSYTHSDIQIKPLQILLLICCFVSQH